MVVPIQQIEIKSRKELRDWLKKNHKKSKSIWLVTFKKSRPEFYLPYEEIVDEAICFGWIDSQPKSLDQFRSMRLLSPRREMSSWSYKNKKRAMRLIKEGLMCSAGLVAIRAAKENGSWSKLDNVEKLKVPGDLMKELRDHKLAFDNFIKFPPSSKRLILEWIESAKTDQTRKRRIMETVDKAKKNLRANHYRQPKSSKT